MSVTTGPTAFLLLPLLHKNLLHPKLQRFSSKRFINLCFLRFYNQQLLSVEAIKVPVLTAAGEEPRLLSTQGSPSREGMQSPLSTQEAGVHCGLCALWDVRLVDGRPP